MKTRWFESTDEEFFKASEFSEYSIKMCSIAKSSPILCNPIDLAHQAPLSMKFSRQEYGSVLPFPPPGHLPHKLTEHVCLQHCRQILYHFKPPGKMYQLKISHSKAKMELSPQQAKLEATGYVNTIRNSEHHSLYLPGPPHFTRLLWRWYTGGKVKILI